MGPSARDGPERCIPPPVSRILPPMSFGLGRGRALDPGEIGLTLDDLPPLPDAPRASAAVLDPRTWYPHPERPFEIEIGTGKGAFLLEEASHRPEVNFLGFEWAREFFQYTADRCRRRGLENVRVLHADATEFLHWRLPDGVVDVVHLYFSDPWPKPRHHKRRVVQDRFLADVHRILVPGGELRIVTDHEGYWGWMEEHFKRWTAPEGVEPSGVLSTEFRVPSNSDSELRTQNSELRLFERLPFGAAHRPGAAAEGELVGTNFERKYAREGRPFHAAVLRVVRGRPEHSME
ncbi:MAG: tRNA (guanosine(46)-N7)-methyltransferase TrmB [Phycisphaeraceae bacterium]|nr:MAG: tRNA (guanosine(46)-N7)-methyltransferase TrmB [Phycisphaeraceae bacterium]